MADPLTTDYYGTNASNLIEYVEEVYALFQKPMYARSPLLLAMTR